MRDHVDRWKSVRAIEHTCPNKFCRQPIWIPNYPDCDVFYTECLACGATIHHDGLGRILGWEVQREIKFN